LEQKSYIPTCSSELTAPSLSPLVWLGISQRTRILSGIQFTTHVIEIFVVETKRFAGSIVNVILTRRSSGEINVFRPQEKPEFVIAQRFSFRKYPKSAQI